MFAKGNKLGRGRPAYSLKSPEILLPGIFAKNNLNWGGDFCRLYRKVKDKKADPAELLMFKTLFELLPYLVTKINVKELDLEKLMNKDSSTAAKDQTQELVKLLEQEKNERPTSSGSNPGRLENGKPTV